MEHNNVMCLWPSFAAFSISGCQKKTSVSSSCLKAWLHALDFSLRSRMLRTCRFEVTLFVARPTGI